RMLDDWRPRLASGDPPTTIDAKLEAGNDLFPHRLFVYQLSAADDAAPSERVQLARGGDAGAFRAKAEPFFQSVSKGIYPVRDGTIDYWEVTAIYAAGSHDETTAWRGRQIPQISTQGVWPLIPRMHGRGITGMV